MTGGLFGTGAGVFEPPSVERRRTLMAGQVVEYTLKRSGKRRTIGLRVDDDGLTVAMPLRSSERWLNSVLQEKAAWIVKALAGWQSRKVEAIRWEDGAAIPFLGESLTLRLVPSLFASAPMLQRRQLFVHVADASHHAAIEQAVTGWLRREAEVLFRERVAHYAPILGAAPAELKLSSARTQWGSCTASGTVHLNWQLIKLPLRLVDYVVVHELAHLQELNHSPAFWAVVQTACADFKKRRAELRRCGIAE
ncbi:MAG TPA: SprT family zinc-dependent metalloprotease [Gallionellaceae bacterium]|nr:SprT family zinc-dependent metalloprotease [Gallionellaceae bacterium]